MTVARPDHWLWDFWLADDGRTHHLFYLHAPKSLGNPDLRHRNARIGHASSTTPPTGPAASRAVPMADGISTTPARTSSRRRPTPISRRSGLQSRTTSLPGRSDPARSAVPIRPGTKLSAPPVGPRRPGATPGCSPMPTARRGTCSSPGEPITAMTADAASSATPSRRIW